MKAERQYETEAKTPVKRLGWVWVWASFMIYMGCEISRLS